MVQNLVSSSNIEESILNIYNKTEDHDLLYRDFAGLNKLKQLLNSLEGIAQILPYEISLEQFIELMESYLEEESITDIQGNNEGVKILTPVTARGQKFQVLFIVGLSQGKYPNLREESFFFKEQNYKDLKSIGLDIKNYYEKLDKESLVFSTALASCNSTLYLSYSENSTGDEKDIPSMFLDEVLGLVDDKRIRWLDVDMDFY